MKPTNKTMLILGTICAVAWMSRFIFILADIGFAGVSWSRQWMDTLFVALIQISEAFGLLSGVIFLFFLLFVGREDKKRKVKA